MPPVAPQIQSPLEEACKLSEQMGNTILLKREDLQPVGCWSDLTSQLQ